MYKKESNLRSLLKGISWRVIATLDTFLIVSVYTCYQEDCSLDFAFKIGFYEFLIKFFIYFLHERLWQSTYKNGSVGNKIILYKTVSWRIMATALTFTIAGTVIKSFGDLAIAIAITELFTKMFLYYGHEKLWLILPLGRIRNYFKRLLIWKKV